MNSMILLIFTVCIQVILMNCNQVFSKHTSNLLDRLLSNYNKYSRPDGSGEPTNVYINLEIKDISFNRKEMTFTIRCVLNQWWLDPRLSYWKYFIEEKNRTYLGFDPVELTHKLSSIKLPNRFQIWLPDTYVLNGEPLARKSSSNRHLIRLHLDGTILLSTRIIFKFKCLMDSTRFPHDAQRCPLHLASFSYIDKEIAYRWIQQNPCTFASKFSINQLDLIKVACTNKTRKLSQLWTNSRKYRSTISVDLYFKRSAGIYLIEIYLPCIILTLTSFCSFFINRESTNVRILIGSMTTLSMIILSIENRLLIKSVPYLTAIDYFIMISFIFILASILEFIIVHQHTKIGYGDIGNFTNLIPLDRIAHLIYNSLQPKEQIQKPVSPVRSFNPLDSKDDQLAAVIRMSSEPMIYDLPITDNLKDDQTILINNQQFGSLSLKRSSATTDLLDRNQITSTPNFLTFPRLNHTTNHLFTTNSSNDPSIVGSVLLNQSNNNSTKTYSLMRKKLASIPEETITCSLQTNQQPMNLQLADNLKLLRQQQEQQLEGQQNYQLNKIRNQ